jgi:rhodanese-related sulfurtransferase
MIKHITKWLNERKNMEKIEEVDAKTAYEWLKKGEAVIIDVREKPEYEMCHVEGMHLLPKSTFSHTQLPAHEGKKLVAMCLGGVRSKAVCNDLAKEGIEAINLAGGITAWERAGLPVINDE